jgi:Cft2 family RNA processing exonuclease
VVLTHAHIDHCGLLPKLVAQGYHGPIHCTPATADLLEYMLADAGRIQDRKPCAATAAAIGRARRISSRSIPSRTG